MKSEKVLIHNSSPAIWNHNPLRKIVSKLISEIIIFIDRAIVSRYILSSSSAIMQPYQKQYGWQTREPSTLVSNRSIFTIKTRIYSKDVQWFNKKVFNVIIFSQQKGPSVVNRVFTPFPFRILETTYPIEFLARSDRQILVHRFRNKFNLWRQLWPCITWYAIPCFSNHIF